MNTRPLSVGIIGSLLASVFASGIGMAPSAQRDLAPPALPQTTTPVCGNIGANTLANSEPMMPTERGRVFMGQPPE